MGEDLQEQPFVTVVVPVYNGSRTLDKCIRALIDQDYPKDGYEIIMVDNNSTDDSVEIIKRYPVALYFERQTQTSYAARNLGVRKSKGSILCFTDSDCIADRGWIKKLVRVFADSRIGGVGGVILSYEPTTQVEKYIDRNMLVSHSKKTHFLPFAATANAAYRRDVFDRAGMFNEAYITGSDMEMSWRMQLKTEYRMGFADKATILHKHRTTLGRFFFQRRRNGMASIILTSLYGHYGSYPKEKYTNGFVARRMLQEIIGLFVNLPKIMKIAILRALGRAPDTSRLILHVDRLGFIFGQIEGIFKYRFLKNLAKSGGVSQEGTKKRLLIVGRSLPRFDRASGHLRMFAIIEILSGSFEITFVSEGFRKDKDCDDTRYVDALERMGVEVHAGRYKWQRILKRPFDAVIFEFYDAAIRNLPVIKKACPKARLLIDTVDVHFARELQMAEVHKDEKMRKAAVKTREEELGIYEEADLIWTVTDEDRRILLDENPKLEIDIVPNIHREEPVERNGIERNTLLFIGNYWHQPNEDAVLYFCREILPLIREKSPDLVLLVVGNAPTRAIKDLASDYVKVIGWVPETRPYLEKCHVSVVPLRYGAGMKGKLGEAMNAGVPIVTTSIGLQGMDVVNGEHLLVGDTPRAFAAEVVRLLNDDPLCAALSNNASRYIRERYGPEVVEKMIASSMERLLPGS